MVSSLRSSLTSLASFLSTSIAVELSSLLTFGGRFRSSVSFDRLSFFFWDWGRPLGVLLVPPDLAGPFPIDEIDVLEEERWEEGVPQELLM